MEAYLLPNLLLVLLGHAREKSLHKDQWPRIHKQQCLTELKKVVKEAVMGKAVLKVLSLRASNTKVKKDLELLSGST